MIILIDNFYLFFVCVDTIGYAALNDTTHAKKFCEITITNHGKRSTKYKLGSIHGVMVQPFISGDDAVQAQSTMVSQKLYGQVYFPAGEYVTVDGGRKVTVKVQITPPVLDEAQSKLFPIYSGFVKVTVLNGGSSSSSIVKVPYAGMVGNWGAAPIWSTTYPRVSLAAATGIYDSQTQKLITKDQDGKTYSSFYVITALSLSTRHGEVNIVSKNGKMRAILCEEHLQPLSSSDMPRSGPLPYGNQPGVYYWNGAVADDAFSSCYQLPSGSYAVEFLALRNFAAFGSITNESNYDIVKTPSFNYVSLN